MKYPFIFLLLCSVLVLRVSAQDTLVSWNFDQSNAVPGKGTGTFGVTGGAAFSAYVGGNPSSGKAYNTNTYPAQLQKNKTAGLELSFASKGYQNIAIAYDKRHSGTAAGKEVVMVSADNGLSFTAVDSFTISASDTWFARTVSLSAFPFVNDQAKLIMRIVSAFEGATGYKATSSSVAYSTAGTWRIDNIRITGKKIDSGKPKLSMALSTDTASEQAQSEFSLQFELSDTLSQDLKLFVGFSGEGITADDYFLPLGDSLVIPAGTLLGALPIHIVDDTLNEGIEFLGINVVVNDTVTSPFVGQATVRIEDNDRPFDLISSIQGNTAQSPKLNQKVYVEAIVTYVSQGTGGFGGFFVQEEDADADTDATTSEGLWIPSLSPVALGDLVRISGTVVETYGLTQLSAPIVVQVSSHHHLPKITTIYMPSSALESYENMLVKVASRMTVSENYNLGRYGELTLSSGGRMYTPTQLVDVNDLDPDGNNYTGALNLSAVLALKYSYLQRKLILDDGSDLELPNPIPFLDINHTMRSGSYTDSILGIFYYDFGNYRINAMAPIHWVYNPRPLGPPVLEGSNIKVASFNVENLFNGQDGDFSTSRGATTEAEFVRQIAKTARAISLLRADVLGLLELENDGFGPKSAIKALVDSVNALSSDYHYEMIVSPSRHPNLAAKGLLGTDAIKAGLIYNTLRVTAVGDYMLDDDTLVHNRIPLAQQFRLNNSNASFVAVINHFKSKGCSGATNLDLDQDDGQSCFNARRKVQADSLYSFVQEVIASTQDEDVVILGDLNAYMQEDPIDLLRYRGMVSLFNDDSAYSYVYMGETGALDHALATPNLAKQLTEAYKWHINCDEPVILNYAYKDAASHKNKTVDLYEKSPYRTSDHDPVVLGFDLKEDVVTVLEEKDFEGFIQMYPNPIVDLLFLQVDAELLGETLELYTLNGQLIRKVNIQGTHQAIDLSSLTKGVYLVKLNTKYFKVFKK